METVEITIHRRSDTGKGAARRMRRSGQVPAVLYGPKRTLALVSIDAEQVERRLVHLEGSMGRSVFRRMDSAWCWCARCSAIP